MKNHNKLWKWCSLAVMAVAICSLASCNAKEDSDDDAYVPTQTVAVTKFTLNPDLRVMANLDSVFFSIDLETGVIFNADSLPKGTNVSKLVPKITYPSTVTSAVIEMSGGLYREGTVNYFTNPADTIDFTGKVTLTLGNADGNLSKTYRIKVNVHKEDPDILFWDQAAASSLPYRHENPKAQKTVDSGNGIYSLIEETDGSLTLASCKDIFSAEWNKKPLSLGFQPEISSLTAAEGQLFILDNSGSLYRSTDGSSWSDTGKVWTEIIGEYDSDLMGIISSANSSQYVFLSDSHNGGILPSGFPIEGFSAPVTLSNRWADYPTLLITGGKTSGGDFSGSTWAYDGSTWARISEKQLPGVYGAAVLPYFSYLKSAANGQTKEFNVLLAFGGLQQDGTVNTQLYISYDYGITWQTAPRNLQLPASFTPVYGADAIPISLQMSSNLSDRWKLKGASRKVNFEIDGDILYWECPYIFIFGGYNAAGTLSPEIYSGVLRRLTFVPLF